MILKKFSSTIGLFLVFWLTNGVSYGQLCTGTLGAPVVNVDFGRGSSDFGPGLKAQLPNLRYTASSCMPDGQYAIRKTVDGCFGTWHNVSSDHTTTDTDGYMMVINANPLAGLFYVDTITGLCGGNVYEFAAWVMNLQKPNACSPSSKPTLEFTIETISGAVLASYKTGAVAETATPTWNQLGLFFQTPVGVQTLVLRIINVAPGGCGNDLALDDITFRPCGPTFSVSIPGTPNGMIDECFGKRNSVTVQANLGVGYNNPVIVWQQSIDSGKTWIDIPGSSGLTYNFQIQGPANYRVRASAAEASNIGVKECRIVSNTVTVNIRELAGNGAKVNSPVCTGELVQFDGGDGSSFSWRGPNGFTSNIKNPSFVAALNRTGTYYLDATSTFGCAGKDTLELLISQSPVATVSNSLNICDNDTVTLTASGGSTYNWIPATGLSDPTVSSPTVVVKNTTTFNVVVSNGTCKDTASVTVNVAKTPTADAGPDMAILAGQSVTLLGQAGGSNINIVWSPTTAMSNPGIATPIVNPTESITYTLLVDSKDGCGSATDNVTVKVFAELKIPNAFSPNGDGINDTWRMDALAVYPLSVIRIFDRYGLVVFKSTGYNTPWDGTRNGSPVPVGMYYYIIDPKNGVDLFRGSVMVVR